MDSKETRELELQLVQLLEGGLNDAEMATLRAHLLSNRQALDHYLRFVTVHAGMRQTCIHTENMPVPDLPSAAEAPSAPAITSPTSRFRLWRRMAAVAAVLFGDAWG